MNNFQRITSQASINYKKLQSNVQGVEENCQPRILYPAIILEGRQNQDMSIQILREFTTNTAFLSTRTQY